VAKPRFEWYALQTSSVCYPVNSSCSLDMAPLGRVDREGWLRVVMVKMMCIRRLEKLYVRTRLRSRQTQERQCLTVETSSPSGSFDRSDSDTPPWTQHHGEYEPFVFVCSIRLTDGEHRSVDSTLPLAWCLQAEANSPEPQDRTRRRACAKDGETAMGPTGGFVFVT
jgi:hypothetical protein